ncbi:MAG: hypothetical protein ACJ76V_14055 [Thermoleophilaceae bacterium]
MTLHVLYRSVATENVKGRPSWYSKDISLVSLLRALEGCAELGRTVFLNGGEMPAHRLELMRSTGEIVETERRPNYLAYPEAIRSILDLGFGEDDLVYMAEDDYLYRPGAFSALAAAAPMLPPSAYLALYATIDGRLPNGDPLHSELRIPRRRPRAEAAEAGGVAWRQATSTTASVAARVATFRADAALHTAAPRSGDWWDHAVMLSVGGHLPYRPRDLFRGMGGQPLERRAKVLAWRLRMSAGALPRIASPHPLFAPLPALATHAEADYLAADVDWQTVAAEAMEWAAGRGMELRAAGAVADP